MLVHTPHIHMLVHTPHIHMLVHTPHIHMLVHTPHIHMHVGCINHLKITGHIQQLAVAIIHTPFCNLHT